MNSNSTHRFSLFRRLLALAMCLGCVIAWADEKSSQKPVLKLTPTSGRSSDGISDKAPQIAPQNPANLSTGITVSPFAAGAFQSGNGESAAGGGVSLEHFFTPKVGMSASYTVFPFDNVVHTVSADVVLRYPVSRLPVTPYLLVGGGVSTEAGDSQGIVRLGGGVDVNLLQANLGVFADGVYNWVEGDKDFTIARLGVRLPF